MTLYKVESILLQSWGGWLCFFPPCGTTASEQCTFEHAGLNCASCSNSITPALTQVPHWSHALLDWVIQPAVHFIVYTPRNGDICKKANKNIPAARNAPGISSPTPGYDSLSALVCFHRTALFQRVDIDPVLLNRLVFAKWMTLKAQVSLTGQTVWRNFSLSCLELIAYWFVWEMSVCEYEFHRDGEINGTT